MNIYELLKEAYLTGARDTQATEAIPSNFNLMSTANDYAQCKVEELNISVVIESVCEHKLEDLHIDDLSGLTFCKCGKCLS